MIATGLDDDVLRRHDNGNLLRFFDDNKFLIANFPVPVVGFHQIISPAQTQPIQVSEESLNLSASYCQANSRWNHDSCLRELVQNWRDQIFTVLGGGNDNHMEVVVEEPTPQSMRRLYRADGMMGYPSKPVVAGFISEEKLADGTFAISLINYSTRLRDDVVVIGESSKVGVAHMAGAHGEGMKVGINRLLSMGMSVVVLTKGQAWRFFHKDRILHMRRAPLPQVYLEHLPDNQDMTAFVVSGFPHEIKRENFLFLSPKPQAQFADPLSNLRPVYLLDPKHAGRVYVKGIYVCTAEGLCKYRGGPGIGIDVRQGLDLDRDRSTVTDEQIASMIAQTLNACGASMHSHITRLGTCSIESLLNTETDVYFEELVQLVYQLLSTTSSEREMSAIVRAGQYASSGFGFLMHRALLKQLAQMKSVILDAQLLPSSGIPLVLPVSDTIQKEELDDFQYFLGLEPHQIIKCKPSMLSVLDRFRKPKKIDDYIELFWEQVLSLADFPFGEQLQGFLRFIQEQIAETFQGILCFDQFLFKQLPELRNTSEPQQAAVRRKSVRVVRPSKGYKNFDLAVFVDCIALLGACNCTASDGRRTCTNACIRTEFLSTLKESLFKVHPTARVLHEKNTQSFLIRLTGGKDQKDVIPSGIINRGDGAKPPSLPTTRPSPPGPHQAPPSSSPGLSNPSSSGGGPSPVKSQHQKQAPIPRTTSSSPWFHSGVQRKTKATPPEQTSVASVRLCDCFPLEDSSEQTPLVIQAPEQEHFVEGVDPGCPAIDLTFIQKLEGFNVYIGKDLLGGKAPHPSMLEPFKLWIDALILVLNELFSTLALRNLPINLHRNIFVSKDTDLIAFNLSGSVFYNALSSPVNVSDGDERLSTRLRQQTFTLASREELLSFWFVTMCHEAAHNLHKGHGWQHESAMEQLIYSLLPVVFKPAKDAPV